MSGKLDSSSDLYELRNYFYLGNYQAAINEASSLSSLQDNDKIDRDLYVYRSYIAQKKYTIVIDEIKNSAPAPLLAVKLLANYFLKTDTKDRDQTITQLKEMLSDSSKANSTLQIVAATIYYNEGSYEEAMRVVHQSNNLEGMALLIQIYLKINRVDQAEKELRAMQKIDDDATLTQIAAAWVSLATGGEKINEAFLTYTDMIEKYNASSLLLNGLAVCNMHLKKYNEAEKNLMQALEKDSSNADTISNLISCYEQQGKAPEVVARQINQLKISVPKHPWLVQYQRAEEEFERVSQTFSFSS